MMINIFKAALGLKAVVLGAFLLFATQTLAGEEQQEITDPASAQTPPETIFSPFSAPLMEPDQNWLNSDLEDAEDLNDPLGQVTSVSQLSDVQPTDWAFQALQTLVERYGAIAGYPDGTFRGDRAITRYEFAAGLNAALERINELFAAGLSDRVREEDFLNLQRLQTEFAPELAALRTRLDQLEVRAAELEANQFSTTTKLNGLITFNIAAARSAGDVRVERIDPNDSGSPSQRGADGKPIVTTVQTDPTVTFSQAVILLATTSFTGKDSLVTTLVTGNSDAPVNVYTSDNLVNTFGNPVLNSTPSSEANELNLLEAFYSFPVSNSVQISVGPRFLWDRFFDTNAFTSTIGRGSSGFNSFGTVPIQQLGRGAGAVLQWRMNQQFDFRLGYVASPDATDPTKGLLSGTNAATAQLTFSPTPNLNLRFIYDHSNIEPTDDGTIETRPIIGVADDGLGGAIENANSDFFVFNFDWLIGRNLGLYGRYAIGNTQLDPLADNVDDGKIRSQFVQVGLAFPDLGKKGSLATLSYVVPFSILEGRSFLVSGGGDGGVQYEIEASYYFPLNPNIAIIPSFYLVGNPNNFQSNPNIYTGVVRTQFSF